LGIVVGSDLTKLGGGLKVRERRGLGKTVVGEENRKTGGAGGMIGSGNLYNDTSGGIGGSSPCPNGIFTVLSGILGIGGNPIAEVEA